MSELSVLIELQSVYDNLQTIRRDLANLPPDLAALRDNLASIARELEKTYKELTNSRAIFAQLTTELEKAQKAEDEAKELLKAATQKIQYSANIRKLDESQRQKAAVARPAKENGERIIVLENKELELKHRQINIQKQFDELEIIFLSEHENQLEARTRLQARKQTLESTLQPAILVKFDRLIKQRMGQAVVAVEDNVCKSCRNRLRTPLIASMRDSVMVFCESCQRILYNP
jgi:predicted  nucleic acid-binding Zn-ribbon protein